MKKMLLTLTATGMLAVPAGMAIAQGDTTDPAAPVTTCECDRVRDRVTEQDRLVVQDQVRTQLRLEDCTCDGDCTGDQVRDRDRVQLGDGTGSMIQTRQGEMGDNENSRGNG